MDAKEEAKRIARKIDKWGNDNDASAIEQALLEAERKGLEECLILIDEHMGMKDGRFQLHPHDLGRCENAIRARIKELK